MASHGVASLKILATAGAVGVMSYLALCMCIRSLAAAPVLQQLQQDDHRDDDNSDRSNHRIHDHDDNRRVRKQANESLAHVAARVAAVGIMAVVAISALIVFSRLPNTGAFNFLDDAITFASSVPLIAILTLTAIKIGEVLQDQHQQLIAERQPTTWSSFFGPAKANILSNEMVYLVIVASICLHALRCFRVSRTTTFRDRVCNSVKTCISLVALAGSVSALVSYINDPVPLMRTLEKVAEHAFPVFDRLRVEWNRGRAGGW
ncbi:hypothetical protein LTR65_008407 [Meristemomyces frigidus]